MCIRDRADSGVWLYNVQTEYWKHDTQLAFLTDTFDQESLALGQRVFNDGSLSLFEPHNPKQHMSISHHAVAEKRVERFKEGKGWEIKWVPFSRNNHFLDALALARAAAGCIGITLIQSPMLTLPTPVPPPDRISRRTSRFNNPNGRPFVARRSRR